MGTRTVRDPVGRLSGPPEAPEDVVAVHVDAHPSQEEKKTCSSRQVSWPRPQSSPAPAPPPGAPGQTTTDIPAPSHLARSELAQPVVLSPWKRHQGSWVTLAVAPTCSRAGPRGPGGLSGRAVQKVVSLQETVEGTEGGGVEHDGQGDGTSPAQSGEHEAPAGDKSDLNQRWLAKLGTLR